MLCYNVFGDNMKKYKLTNRGKITILFMVITLTITIVSYISTRDKKIDCFNNLQVSFTGFNYKGKINIKYVNTYKNVNKDIKEYLKNIKYKYSKGENLTNGDIIKIELIYDKSKLKDLGINIVNDYKEYTVYDLKTKYTNSNDIDVDLYDYAYQLVNDKASEDNDNINFVKSYYQYNENSDNILIFVYNRTYQFNDSSEVTKYIAYYLPFDYDFNKNKVNIKSQIVDVETDKEILNKLKTMIKATKTQEISFKS